MSPRAAPVAPTLRDLLFPKHNRRPVSDAWMAMKREYRAVVAAARLLDRVRVTNTDEGNGWTDKDWGAVDRVCARLRSAGKRREGSRG